MDPEFGNEQGGDASGWDGNDEGDANNDGRACIGDEDDFDDLEDMIRALGPEILLKSPKGLENFERVKKISRRLCMVLKRVVRHTGHCYVLCYLHEMWSYERFLSVLSQYVHNRAYPEGSMIEGYSSEKSSSAVKST